MTTNQHRPSELLRRAFTAFCIFSTIAAPIRADVPSRDVFIVGVTLSQEHLLLYEPLMVSVSITNTTAQEASMRSTWASHLETRFSKSDTWMEYNRPGPQFSPLPTEKKILLSKQSLAQLWPVDLDEEGKPIFPQAGKYWIRGSFLNADRWSFLSSQPQLLEVKEPVGEEKNAALYIAEHQLYRYFTLQSAALYAENSLPGHPQDDMKFFLKTYPASHYAPWVQLGLLLVKSATISQTGSERESLEKELEDLASSLPPSIAAAAWLDAGEMANRRSDGEATLRDYRKAIAGNRNPAIRDYLHITVEPWLSGKWKTHLSLYEQTVNRFMAKHYDVWRCLLDLQRTPEGAQYDQLLTELERQARNHQISLEEFDRRHAALLQSFVIRYGKPLGRAEWARRQSQFASEESQVTLHQAQRQRRENPPHPSAPPPNASNAFPSQDGSH